MIERLRRALVMIGIARNGMPQTDPPQTFTGPMVTLIDEFSASDGDIFPYRFKTLGLGKLIGKRTWGGVIGIRESLPLVDGGQFFKPEFAPFIQRTANNGSSKVTALILTSSSIMIPGKNSKAKTSSSIARSRRSRRS